MSFCLKWGQIWHLFERQLYVSRFKPVRDPPTACQIRHQRLETVRAKPIFREVRRLFPFRRFRWFRRTYRISTLALLWQLLVFEQDGRQSLAHMPFHIVGQHAQKDVRRYTIFGAVANRSNQEIYPFQTSEDPFHN